MISKSWDLGIQFYEDQKVNKARDYFELTKEMMSEARSRREDNI